MPKIRRPPPASSRCARAAAPNRKDTMSALFDDVPDNLDEGLAEAIENAPGHSTSARSASRGRGKKKAQLGEISSTFVPNATYAKEPKRTPTLIEQYTDAAVLSNLAGGPVLKFLFSGLHGTGKTSYIVSMTERYASAVSDAYPGQRIDVIVVPLQTITPDDMLVVGVNKNTDGDKIIEYNLYNRWVDPTTKKIIVFDEVSRAAGDVLNQILSVVHDQRLGDVHIPGVLAVIGLQNEGRAYQVQKLDYALASRFTATIDVGLYETPWNLALAASYDAIDLGKFFAEYEALKDLDSRVPDGGVSVRDILVPRTLDHLIWNLTRGNPGSWCLPHPEGEAIRVPDTQGNDLLTEAIDRLAGALGMRNSSSVPDKLMRVLEQGWESSRPVMLISQPGLSKTASTRAWLTTNHPEATLLVWDGGCTNPDTMFLPLPTDGRVEIALMEVLRMPGEKVIMLDDIWRADGAVRAKFMELLTEGTIGGIKIPGLHMIVATTNPREIAGIRQNVGKPDLAQADRFFANVVLSEEDMPAAEYLLATYGEEAAPFLDWRSEDLDDAQRALVNFRVTEALIQLDALGLPLNDALPKMGGKRIPVPLHDLKRRLDDRPVARIRAIAENVDRYSKYISEGSLPHAYEVVGAFRRAQPSQLVEHVDAVMTLLPLLRSSGLERTLVTMLKQGGKRTMFWFFCLEGNRDSAVKAFD